MSKNAKKLIFPGTTLAASFYISFLFTLGIIIGYFGTDLFCRKFIKTGRIKKSIFGLGKWEFHLHHWISGSLVVFAAYLTNLFSFLPILLVGTLGGLIFHDLYTDKKWYKVIYRKEL